jgi:hypothetical protein
MRAPLASLPDLRVAALAATLALAASGASGCSELSRFSTATGESYCGAVTDASFVRSDALAKGTKMRLQLDVDALESRPGTLWTGDLVPGDPVSGVPAERFTATPLHAIKQLPADTLSTLTFGEGSLKSSIALAELGHTEVVVVLSLMQSGDVVVRLIRGDGQETTFADGTPKPTQIFGVFKLVRTPGDCGPM